MTIESNKFRIAVRRFPPFESAIRKQWESFEEQRRTGLELEIVALDLTPLTEVLFSQDGLKNGSLDVAFLNTDWVASAYERGDLLDLADFLRRDPPQDYPLGWSDSMLRLQEINGFVAGVPYHDGPECLIYRTDLFENEKERARYRDLYGIELRPPTSWADFRQVACYFQRPKENLYGCVFGAYPDGHNTVYDFLLHLWTRGGDLQSQNGSFLLQTPEAESALTFYREMLADTSGSHPRCREFDSVQSGKAFANGEAAMMVNWFGFAVVAEVAEDSRVSGAVGVGSVPCDPGHSSASLNIYWLLSVAAGTVHPEISYQFVRHCASAEMDKLLTAEGGVGCRRSTWCDPTVNSRLPFYHRLEELHKNAREIPRLAKWPKINSAINQMVLEARTSNLPLRILLQEAEAKIVHILEAKTNP